MVNDKMVNGFMKKKIYITPLMEIQQVNLTQCLLDGSPVEDPRPIPPIGPAPARRSPVF
jgi:hypothetical protein